MGWHFKRKPVEAKVTRLTDGFRRRKIVYIHAADLALPGFTFKGIQVYGDRSLICDGGVMVVARGAFSGAAAGYISNLVSLGVGPDAVIEVDIPRGCNLYDAILASPVARAEILRLVREQNFRIEFFNTRNGLEERFIRGLGLDWADVASFPSHVADQGNNKAWIRRLARSLGLENLFPWHVLIRVPVGLRLLAALLVLTYMRGMAGDDGRRFVVKLTNWASGLGQLYTRSRRALLKFFLKNWRQAGQLVIEEDLGAHTSITHVRRYNNGRLEDEWSTVQLIARTKDGVEDLGRVLSTGLPHGLINEDRSFMRAVHKKLDRSLLTQARNATGVICLDCARRNGAAAKTRGSVIWRLHGFFGRLLLRFMWRILRHRGYTQLETNGEERVVLEANIRVTFSDYVRQLMNQVKRILGVKQLNCIQFKVRPARAQNFQALQAELGDQVFSVGRRQGVIPMVPRCLASGYVYLVAFAEDYDSARRIAVLSATRLGDNKFAELLSSAE